MSDALVDVPEFEGETLLATEARLEASIEAWRNQLRSSEISTLDRALLSSKRSARQARLNSLRDVIRESRSQYQVRRKSVERQVASLVSIDRRLVDLNERWQQQALEFYGFALLWGLGIIVAAIIVIRIVRIVAKRIVKRFNAELEHIDRDTEARAKTISAAFTGLISAVIWVLAILMILGRFGIDYQPLLVATGGIGLAVGFGAQSLVKDFFSGFFILLENQFTVGDVITIDGKTGTVEEINLRT
ncbi:MAG: mechanosensitive ion channel, partial [Planctomycetes bacterium]|nr:mechanosensitive ion channel [Planctomycetota bacterium]